MNDGKNSVYLLLLLSLISFYPKKYLNKRSGTSANQDNYTHTQRAILDILNYCVGKLLRGAANICHIVVCVLFVFFLVEFVFRSRVRASTFLSYLEQIIIGRAMRRYAWGSCARRGIINATSRVTWWAPIKLFFSLVSLSERALLSSISDFVRVRVLIISIFSGGRKIY